MSRASFAKDRSAQKSMDDFARSDIAPIGRHRNIGCMYQTRVPAPAPTPSTLFPVPLVPGAWTVPDNAARHWIVAQWSRALGKHDFFLKHDVPELRWLPLPFYPGHMLVEAAVVDAKGRIGAANMVIGPTGCTRVDGQSAQWHELNEKLRTPVTDIGKAEAYLLFFCSAIHGSGGRFRVITEIDDSCFRRGLEEREAVEQALRAAIVPLQFQPGPDCFIGEALILYERNAFKARMRIHVDGRVDMEDDERIDIDEKALARELCQHDLRWFG
jgi:hypothetical protein